MFSSVVVNYHSHQERADCPELWPLPGSCSVGRRAWLPLGTNAAALPGHRVPAHLSPLALREDVAVSTARLMAVLVKPP